MWIKLTVTNGTTVRVNFDNVLYFSRGTETVLQFVGGKSLPVTETPDEIMGLLNDRVSR